LGADLDDLYITTASVGMSSEQEKRFPNAGGLFRVKVPHRGVPSVRFAAEL
jgi:sugar lactone lactonase YvrE